MPYIMLADNILSCVAADMSVRSNGTNKQTIKQTIYLSDDSNNSVAIFNF